MDWLLVVLASLVGSVGSVILIGATLLLRAPMRWLANLLSLAVGTLLGAAFLGLLPGAVEMLSAETALTIALLAILGFALLERLLAFRIGAHRAPEATRGAAILILLGDALHNTVDGIAIGAAFAASLPLGLATTLAVVTHEIPQEVGDYAVLVEGGFNLRQALFWNSLSGLPSLPAALMAFWASSAAEAAVPYFLAVGAGAFIYVALADLMPHLHEVAKPSHNLMRGLLVALGVALIWWLETSL